MGTSYYREDRRASSAEITTSFRVIELVRTLHSPFQPQAAMILTRGRPRAMMEAMDNFLIIGGWGLYAILAHSLGTLMGLKRSDAWKRSIPTPEHLRFPKAVLMICAPCSVSMVVWGFLHLRWFMAVMDFGAGYLLAVLALMSMKVKLRVLVVKSGWIPLVILNGYLWLRGFIR